MFLNIVCGGQNTQRIAAQKKHDVIDIAMCMGVQKTRAVLGCSSGAAHQALPSTPLCKRGSRRGLSALPNGVLALSLLSNNAF